MSGVDISPINRIARHARFHPDLTAIEYEGRPISYAELHERVGRLAGALVEDGVMPGARIAHAGLNSATFLLIYFAAARVGAVLVPLNSRLAAPEVRAVLADAAPDVLIAEPVHAALLGADVDALGIRRALLVDDDPSAPAAGPLAGSWGPLSAFVADSVAGAAPAAVPRFEDDVAALLYTSGTTGRPKGVVLTHGNLWWNQVNVDAVVDTRFGDVVLAAAPLFHIGGFNALVLGAISRGGTVLVRREFDPARALDDLVRSRVTGMFLVPAMLAGIQRQPGFTAADLSALRSTIVAGAPVPPALIASFAEKGVLLQQAWGLTETAPFATYLEASMTSTRLGSCGVPMPYGDVRVTDPVTLQPVLESGATGELWVRGPNVSHGYWNDPAATAAVFTDDGWFRTGDIGFADEDGYLVIVDRLKDMIITGGENVYPAEVENVLAAHEAIDDVAVVGAPDERWGECVCAVVAFRGEALTLDALRDHLDGRIARYKLPTRLVVVDEVQRNGAGKLDKPAIRAFVAARASAARVA